MQNPIRPANDAATLAVRIRQDPLRFVHDFFDEELLGKQGEILEALRDMDEVYVRSCHDSGKTYIAARAVLWWLMAHPDDSIVLTTAPTWAQVENLLWREIQQAYGRAKIDLGGRMLTTHLDLGPKWYAIGLSTDRPENLQGYHATNMLVIIDEADAVPTAIWNALDSVLTTANAKVLAIGNPLDPASEFKKRHDVGLTKPQAKCIRIAADDVLPLTDEGAYPFLLQRAWVEDKRQRWGETSSLYMGKVLAEWPDQGSDTLIPISWLIRAKGREVQRKERALGVDVARFGTNRTVRTLMAGGWMEWSKATAKEDTMQTAGRVHQDIEQYGPIATAIDDSGVGGGVTDRLKQLGRVVRAINNGERPDNAERFANKGSELWWQTREAFEKDMIGFSMDDADAVEELIADLNRPKYDTDSHARIRVDKYGLARGKTENSLSDEELASRSPDRGDSFVLAFAAAKPLLAPERPRPRNLIAERDLGNPNTDHMTRVWLKAKAERAAAEDDD
jgi:hypothetical protein